MRTITALFALCAACSGSFGERPGTSLEPSSGPAPSIGACPVFPAGNDWNRDISGDPIDARSSAYMAHMGAGSLKLHANFGSNPTYGMPYAVVSGTQPRLPMQFLYSSQSDPGPYPFPEDVPIQAGQDSTGDRHAVVIDKDNCLLYETWDTHWLGPGQGYRAGAGAVFDLRTGALRPDGWTSATASGLPEFAGLVRYEEATSGEIRHALAFTAGMAARAWVHPGTHYGNSLDSNAPPMATRVRLDASFDVTRYTGLTRTILVALQHYGMFLIDESTTAFVGVSGTKDSRWPDPDLEQLKTVPMSAFQVVQLPAIHQK
ncbi:MAG: hypothetical protein E6J61_18610 [Deltaproteobacteria bacterium]|nr:MAG: hypothetical protein E6J61_18610 [Deltaproteobacteria bacterium]